MSLLKELCCPEPATNKRFIIGTFSDEEGMIHSAEKIRKENIDIYDIYTPFPVHGIDHLLDIKRSRLPIICFFGAGAGLAFSLWFQIWTSKTSWPLNVGGKPFNSFPAFIPVAFEITVLFGALLTVAAFLFRARLFPGNKTITPDLRITDDRFAIVVEDKNVGIDLSVIEEIFMSGGAEEISTKGGEEWEQ